MGKVSKRLLTMALAGAIVLSGIGMTGVATSSEMVQIASAASGSQNVGGGKWTWKTIPGVYAESVYYHAKKRHSASARVGGGRLARDVKPAGQTAKASAYGVGTTYVWWNTY